MRQIEKSAKIHESEVTDEQLKRLKEQSSSLFVAVRTYFFTEAEYRAKDISLACSICSLIRYIQTGDKEPLICFKNAARVMHLINDDELKEAEKSEI